MERMVRFPTDAARDVLVAPIQLLDDTMHDSKLWAGESEDNLL